MKRATLPFLLTSLLLAACTSTETMKPFFSMNGLEEYQRDTLTNIDGNTYLMVHYSDTINEKDRACILVKSDNDSTLHQLQTVPTDFSLLADGHTLQLEDFAYQSTVDLLKLPEHIAFGAADSLKHFTHFIWEKPHGNAPASQLHMKVDALLPADKQKNATELKRINQYLQLQTHFALEDSDSPDTLFAKYYDLMVIEFENETPTIEGSAPGCEVALNIRPLWQSDDEALTTYHYYFYTYTMGAAHGLPSYCYFTFASGSELPLGFADLFKKEKVNDVFRMIGEKLKERQRKLYGNDASDDMGWAPTAELDDFAEERQARLPLSYEKWNGKIYPRPALCDRGVVFTYQVYEKDCYAAGPVCIVLTWNELTDCLKHPFNMTHMP